MKIISTELIQKAGRETVNGFKTFLALHKRTFEHKGRTSDYFMATRGENIALHEVKRPDAVVIVATYWDGTEDKLLMVSEFRIPVGTRVLGFPAGLIDEADYESGVSHRQAAICAAIREVKEETNLDLYEITEVSPANLYTSAGMSNESITYVFGRVSGDVSNIGLESSEDIETLLLSRVEVSKIIACEDPQLAHSKTAWPFMRSFWRTGDLV